MHTSNLDSKTTINLLRAFYEPGKRDIMLQQGAWHATRDFRGALPDCAEWKNISQESILLITRLKTWTAQ